MKIAIPLSCCFLSLAAHILKYTSTSVTTGPTFTAVVELDEKKIMHWDSNTMKMVPDTEWMKNVSILEKETEFMLREKGDLEFVLNYIMDHFQHSKGTHSLSQIYGCQINDENKNGLGFKRLNYDQEEFLSLNLTSVTWTPANDEAQKFLTKTEWNSKKTETDRWKEILEVDCIKSLQLYVNYSMSHDSLKVKVFQLPSSSAELVCFATGFFPKAVMMSWQKDGEEVNEDVEVRETLPNQDGSFQKRIILRISPEDLQKNNYTCVIQHSSLKEELRVEAEKIYHEAFNHGVGVGVAVGVGVGFLLVLAVVGMVLWKKKKNSGSKPVSSGPDPDKDEFIHPNDKTKKELIDEPKRLRFQDL